MTSTSTNGKLTKNCEALMNTITHFGCITKEQLFHFMPTGSYSEAAKEAQFKKDLNFIKYSRLANVTDNYITPINCPVPDLDMIDCISTMLELCKKKAESPNYIDTLIAESFVSSAIDKLTFILNGKKIIHLVPVFSDTQLTHVYFLQERHTNNPSKDPDDNKNVYFFIFKNADVIEKFNKIELTFPYGASIITKDADGNESIQLFAQ